MYRYIKSNGRVFHELKILNFILEFIPNASAITSTEEISVSMSEEIGLYVLEYLDEIAQLVSVKLTKKYPVFTGSTKLNKAISSVYIPVALRDENLPYRLKVGLEGFARTNRISGHNQESEDSKLSEAIVNERNKTMKAFKSELSNHIEIESKKIPYGDENKTNDEIKSEKLKTLDEYEFPEDFSIVLITSDDKKAFNDADELVDEICKLIFSYLSEINE